MDSDDTGVVQFEHFVGTNYEASPSGSNKGKYYKQTYRTAWEQMPDFKGWLRGVPGEPTRAFCCYCQKSLHAHRLSLLKHTCTIRHQKAAQQACGRQQKKQLVQQTREEENDELDELPVNLHANAEITFEQAQYDDDDGQDEGEEFKPMPLLHIPKPSRQNTRVQIMSSKPVISTHVLDTSRGQPVAGLQVSLYKLMDGRWTYINEGITFPDGRFNNFLSREDFSAGRYKLHFDVDRYFEGKEQESLYPFIEIVFDCRSPTDHYHIPLLLTPFGYSTYRGT